MKVVKKVKLLEKDGQGNFIKSQNVKVLRTRMVISEQSIEDAEKVYPMTGIAYVVDEEATKERDELKSGKKAPKEVKNETLKFEGLAITAENVEQFAKDNDIAIGNIKDPEKKLKKVKEFISKQ